MPCAIYNLGVEVWHAGFPHLYLTVLSPYQLPADDIPLSFGGNRVGGRFGFHRDNGLLDPTGSHGQLEHREDKNSQIRGLSVLCYTVGTPMKFSFRHRHRRRPPPSPGIFQAKKEKLCIMWMRHLFSCFQMAVCLSLMHEMMRTLFTVHNLTVPLDSK